MRTTRITMLDIEELHERTPALPFLCTDETDLLALNSCASPSLSNPPSGSVIFASPMPLKLQLVQVLTRNKTMPIADLRSTNPLKHRLGHPVGLPVSLITWCPFEVCQLEQRNLAFAVRCKVWINIATENKHFLGTYELTGDAIGGAGAVEHL
jgi:hypothetical protein